ncbi:MAG TPA: WYL domain-containing protein [Methylococcus sp.]|nr:WYL domain-containing protein [Methylococcus sp.]
MDRTERFYRIEQLLRQRRSVSVREFLDELSVSRATFVRDLEYLRERLRVPIEWDRTKRGYRLAEADGSVGHELPGLWFNASEIHALLTMRQLLAELQPGLLEPHVRPLLNRLNLLLEKGDRSLGEIEHRVKIVQVARRAVEPRFFELVAHALFARRRLCIRHHNRETGVTLERVVSPQRLVHYRETWYIDAWCHLREAVRRFALDALNAVEPLDAPAPEIEDEVLRNTLDSGYGVFSGPATERAALRFSPRRAPWVSCEIWHPDQHGEREADGHYRLILPYGDDRELLMDILKHGPEVEVLAPETLRRRVRETVSALSALYLD